MLIRDNDAFIDINQNAALIEMQLRRMITQKHTFYKNFMTQ